MSGQSPLVMKFKVPTIPVEVLSKSNEINILKEYLIPSPEEYLDTSTPYMEAATVDLQRLLDSDDEQQKFESLLNSWGVFQLVNHGIQKSKLDQVRQITKDFFNLPLEEKQKYSRSQAHLRGWKYDKMEGWGNDQVREHQPFYWNDRLMLNVFPSQMRNPKLWPNESLPNFSEVIEEYAEEMRRIRDILFKAVSKMLKLPEDNLLIKYAKEGGMITRLNWYPPCPFPDRIWGSRPHSDTKLFTILLQGTEVEGLHFENDDKWYVAPIIPDALVVNASDMLEIMTNGIIKSTPHRVMTNAEIGRTSIVFAIAPPANVEIGPLKELIDEKRPQLYPNMKNFSDISADYFTQGKIFIKELRKVGLSFTHHEGTTS